MNGNFSSWAGVCPLRVKDTTLDRGTVGSDRVVSRYNSVARVASRCTFWFCFFLRTTELQQLSSKCKSAPQTVSIHSEIQALGPNRFWGCCEGWEVRDLLIPATSWYFASTCCSCWETFVWCGQSKAQLLQCHHRNIVRGLRREDVALH